MKLKLGINEVSNKDYHADREYLSSSNLKMILKEPDRFYRERILGEKSEQKQSNALDEGSLMHTLILEPQQLEKEYVFFEGFRKQGSQWDMFLDSLSSKGDTRTVMSSAQRIKCNELLKVYNRRKEAVELISGGVPEQSICTTIMDIPIKARFDYVNVEKGYVADVKTTGYSSDPDTFKLTLKDLYYDLSAALYLQVAEAHYGRSFDFYFIVLSKKDQTCDVLRLGQNSRKNGQSMVTEALKKYKNCLTTGIWTDTVGKEEKSGESAKYEIKDV